MDEGPSTAKIITVTLDNYTSRKRRAAVMYDLHSQEIRGLEEYTDYIIQILGYTVKDGQYSPPFTVRTAEAGIFFVRYFHSIDILAVASTYKRDTCMYACMCNCKAKCMPLPKQMSVCLYVGE